MSATRRTFLLGRQPIPDFAGYGTVFQRSMVGSMMASFPAGLPTSPFNVACLCFYYRVAGRQSNATGLPPFAAISSSFWANRILSGVRNIFGVSEVIVPPRAEYYSLSWLEPNFTGNPFFPEEMFSIRWRLVT